MRRNHGTVETTIPDQQITAKAQPQYRHFWIQSLEKGTEVFAIGGLKEVTGRAAHLPAGVVGHGLIATNRAANSNECHLLVCGHDVNHP